jgi:hypothetical protein
MLDQLSVENLVRQQIALEVGRKIDDLTGDRAWLEAMESHITQYVQDRITARFANIETVPDLIQAVKNSVINLIDQGRIPGIKDYVDQVKIQQAVDHGVEAFVSTVLDNLSMDATWIQKIQNLVDQRATDRVLARLSDIDLNTVFAAEIDRSLARWKTELQNDFSSRGIKDISSSDQMTVSDQGVDCLGTVTSTDAVVHGSLVTKNLVVTGVINTDNSSWDELASKIAEEAFSQTSESWKQSMVQEILDLARQQGIDFQNVNIGGSPVIENGTLSDQITRSSLTQIGHLQDLVVKGHSRLNDTLDVSSRRVGINTGTPDMALSVWDEEVAISLGKLSKQQAFMGTSRASSLTIGVNRKPAIEIDLDLLTTVQGLRIQRHRMSFAAEVPGTSGTRGDIVFNNDPKPNSAFAWVCLGGFKWQALRSAA